MERGGPVLVPNLQGEPRLKKPPLPTWIAAAAVRPTTAAALDAPDRAVRDAAFRRLAWEARWPSLLSSCLLTLAVYALGRLVDGPRVGLAAAAVCGSTILFLRFGRAATTDVQLALWVAVTNAFLAAALFRGRAWLGFVGAGVAFGLAFMSKGPVALVQSVLPVLAFVAWRRLAPRAAGGDEGSIDAPPGPARGAGWPIVVGVLAALAIILPWPLAVVARQPNVWSLWREEITREGATDLPPDPWYVYLVIFVWVAPWVAWFVAGVIVAAQRLFGPVPAAAQTAADAPPQSRGLRGFPTFADPGDEARYDPAPIPTAGRAGRGMVLSLFLMFIPIGVMTLFKDKNERYLFPMVAPAALLIAQALVGWIEAGRPRDAGAAVVRAAHWATLAVLALGVPLAAAVALRTIDGRPWLSGAAALGTAAAAGAVVAAGFLLERRRPYAVVAATAGLMLLLQYAMLAGYRDDAQGRAEFKPLADLVWSTHPDADVYEIDVSGRARVYSELPIYLNRIIRKTARPEAIERTDRPQVVAYFFRRQAPDPQLAPPWTVLGEGGQGKGRWRLYVLPARQ